MAVVNSSTDGGFFTPLGVLSLYTNQLPGGSMFGKFEIPPPSQIMAAVGTTGSGAGCTSVGAAADPLVVPEWLEAAAAFWQGHSHGLAAPCGPMQPVASAMLAMKPNGISFIHDLRAKQRPLRRAPCTLIDDYHRDARSP